MKVCPVCRSEYEDDQQTCPSDGEVLIDGDALPENPELVDVIAVSPDEATAMVDLEALSPVIKERLDAKREDERKAALLADEEEDDDPDATGTLMAPDLSRVRPSTDDEFEEGQDHTAPALPSGAALSGGGAGGPPDAGAFEKPSPTEVVKRAPGQKPVKTNRNKGKGKGGLIAAVLVLGVVVAGGLAGGLWYFFGSSTGAVLTVTTTPPGASVRIDGEAAGAAPLQQRVKPGSHTIELALDGYEPFKEVVDVPREGLPFLQPLKAIAGKKKPPTETQGADGGADETAAESPTEGEVTPDALAAAVEKLLAAGDTDGALDKVKALLQAAPDDPRSDTLFDKVSRARAESADGVREDDRRGRGRRRDRGTAETRAGAEPGDGDDERAAPRADDAATQAAKVPASERKAKSREAFQEGEQLYNAGRLEDAKRKYKLAVQLDTRYAAPHRAVARIYQREGDGRKARYHLKRYLKLGGDDADFKVRRWLEKNGG